MMKAYTAHRDTWFASDDSYEPNSRLEETVLGTGITYYFK
jgi:hypothetical protein